VTFSKRSNLRTDIRSKLLDSSISDKSSIRPSTLFVSAALVEEIEEIEDVDIKVAPYGTVVTTPVTIWVGVLPDTLTGEVAFHSSNDTLDILKKHGISNVDVTYHESVARGFSGPEVFAPVSDLDPLKAIIDPMTTALGLPIAGLKALKSQGIGFYLRVGKDLYAVTARHILFPEDEGNNPYSYVGAFFSPRR
jgi:hypothetical protein